MNSFIVSACVYVLELEDQCWYVGVTYNLNLRLGQHWAGEGAKWTRLHKPVCLVETIYPADRNTENETTEKYFELYGRDKVRGGKWCKLSIPE